MASPKPERMSGNIPYFTHKWLAGERGLHSGGIGIHLGWFEREHSANFSEYYGLPLLQLGREQGLGQGFWAQTAGRSGDQARRRCSPMDFWLAG